MSVPVIYRNYSLVDIFSIEIKENDVICLKVNILKEFNYEFFFEPSKTKMDYDRPEKSREKIMENLNIMLKGALGDPLSDNIRRILNKIDITLSVMLNTYI
ncbi:MAG: hypothetical protein ACRCX2_27910 [Paraclostridium sp.]